MTATWIGVSGLRGQVSGKTTYPSPDFNQKDCFRYWEVQVLKRFNARVSRRFLQHRDLPGVIQLMLHDPAEHVIEAVVRLFFPRDLVL